MTVIDYHEIEIRNLAVMATGNRAILKSNNLSDTVVSPPDDGYNKKTLELEEEERTDANTNDSFLSKAINQRKVKLKNKKGKMGRYFFISFVFNFILKLKVY